MWQPEPVPFTAACDGCGGDASWRAWLLYVEGRTVTRWHVDCPSCGPCPCEHHEIEGVAA